MNLLISSHDALTLWHKVVQQAENACAISLDQEVEIYLTCLLIRYTNKPDIAKQILADAFLKALQKQTFERQLSLQHVGDQCLLLAGLFPRAAQKKRVNIKYFVDLGRSAYGSISHTTNDLYASLAFQFVPLMDILQSIRHPSDLMPLEAYEQWHTLGSKRALKFLQEYTDALPLKLKD